VVIADKMGIAVTFAAVVVSYNRIELLKKCLVALEGQTRPLDEIIVVDNGSTDGSAEYIDQNHPDITLFRTGANLGGAGGFAWGVEIALAHGHRGAWLMDDDAEPELDALAPITALYDRADPAPAFVASLVTVGRTKINKLNGAVFSADLERQVQATQWDAIAADMVTFVGVMINLEVAARTHLPLSDFFIWVDDSEYTARLSDQRIGVMLPSSRVNHPDNKPASNDMGWKLFYYLRNRLWYVKARRTSLGGKGLEFTALCIHAAKQFPVAADKKLWFTSVVRGLWLGLFTRPQTRQPGELLRTLDSSARAALAAR